MAKVAKDADLGLSLEEARTALLPALQAHFAPTRQTLTRLGTSPSLPQVLLLEGAVEEERQAMALWWACLQQCERCQEHNYNHDHSIPLESPLPEPCGACPACLHIGARIHPDVLAYDGRISNTADKETPGPVRALNKENATALKGKLGDTTRSGKKRVVIISGIEDSARSGAANALLKVLEEPSATSIFVLLTAQREQILPTLVSRSMVYTLPWPDPHAVPKELASWEHALANFLNSGQGWWDLTSGKGAVTPEVALQVLLLCQKRLVTSLAVEDHNFKQGPLTPHFQKFSAEKRLKLSQKLDAASEALHYNVTPSRVLNALVVDMYTLIRT